MEFRYDSPDHVDRAICAINETSEEILTILSNDPYYWVRFRVAQNPNTPFNLVQKLAEDSDDWVAKNAKDVLIIREPIQRQIPPNSSWEFIEWAEEMDVDVLDKFINKTQEQIVKEQPLYSNDRIFFKKIAWIVLFGSLLSAMFLTSFPMVSGTLYIFSILSAFIGWAVL